MATLTIQPIHGLNDAEYFYFYEFDDSQMEIVNKIKEYMGANDTNSLYNYLNFSDNFFESELITTINIGDPTRFYIDLERENKEKAKGTLEVGEYELVEDTTECYISDEHHPKYLLLMRDTITGFYTSYSVPDTINIKGIQLYSNNIAPRRILDSEWFGDEIISLSKIYYDGNKIEFEDEGDCGTYGDIDFELFEFNDKQNRYNLICETKVNSGWRH